MKIVCSCIKIIFGKLFHIHMGQLEKWKPHLAGFSLQSYAILHFAWEKNRSLFLSLLDFVGAHLFTVRAGMYDNTYYIPLSFQMLFSLWFHGNRIAEGLTWHFHCRKLGWISLLIIIAVMPWTPFPEKGTIVSLILYISW